MLPLICFCGGFYLGLHFNVLVLAPICALGAGAYLATSPGGLSASLIALVLPLIALQMGYFLGLTARAPFALLRARLNFGSSKEA